MSEKTPNIRSALPLGAGNRLADGHDGAGRAVGQNDAVLGLQPRQVALRGPGLGQHAFEWAGSMRRRCPEPDVLPGSETEDISAALVEDHRVGSQVPLEGAEIGQRQRGRKARFAGPQGGLGALLLGDVVALDEDAGDNPARR
jgi:hypothetical protein